ncbi:hypothetical protein [Streptomyces xiamenensis]|uniref:hypothetical protein n=1 Tax=Streptomyces xiamenensis TaxID=408015 RepID=UPI0037D7D280
MASGTSRGAVAALLNASGLGAGYLYLRLWGRAVAAWAGTAVLVLSAIWIHASGTPWFWLTVFALWLATMVRGGWKHGAAAPPAARPPWLPLTAAVTLLALVTAGVVQYRGGPGQETERGDAAHAAGDCARAVEHYDAATAGRNELTFSPALERAADGRAGCRILLTAEAAAAEADFTGAINGYGDYVARYDGSPPWPGAPDRLAELHLGQADSLADGGTIEAAFAAYAAIPAGFPDSEPAAAVPERLDALYARHTRALADEDHCAAVGELRPFITLRTEHRGDPLAEGLAERAEAAFPDALYECGITSYRDDDHTSARTALEEFRSLYPDDGRTERAGDTLIAIEIADIGGGATGDLPDPTPAGSAPGGTATVEIVNDSPEALEILYTGAETGTKTVDACGGCTTQSDLLSGWSDTACQAGIDRPTTTIRLPAGTYEFVVRTPEDSSVTPFYGSWELSSGTAYSDCYYIETSLY